MNPQFFSLLLTAGTILAWVGWVILVFNINPEQTGFLGICLFYLSLSLSLIGSFFLLGKSLRFKFFKRQTSTVIITNAVRQSMLFTIMVIGLLALNAQGMASLWNLLLLLLVLTALEFFFISRHRHSRPIISYERTN